MAKLGMMLYAFQCYCGGLASRHVVLFCFTVVQCWIATSVYMGYGLVSLCQLAIPLSIACGDDHLIWARWGKFLLV